MNFYNQVCTALLTNEFTDDKSFAEMQDAFDQMWNNFTGQYLRLYREIHIDENGKVKEETDATKRLLKGTLRLEWFNPRAVRSHKWIHEIDDDSYTIENMRAPKRKALTELFDWMFQRLDQEFKDGIYFYCWSRDCDQCESDNIYRFKHWLEAAEWIQSFYDGLEGPGHVEPTTFKHYITFQQEFRDRRAEQYNY